MSIKFEYNKTSPLSIFCVGHKFEESKDLSTEDLKIFIERDLDTLIKKYRELRVSYSLDSKRVGYDAVIFLKVSVVCENISSYFLLKPLIENILWSYNKQVLLDSEGSFSSLYQRFKFEVNFHMPKSQELKSVV